jgi:hypothetical protein
MSRTADENDTEASNSYALPTNTTDSVAAAVANAAVYAPIVAWAVAILAGSAAYAGPVGASTPNLPLMWYDDVFVRAGPFLPLAPLAFRIVASAAAGDSVRTRRRAASLPPPSRALAVYAAVALVRLGVYLVGRAASSAKTSDHVFLGAAVAAAAHAEAVAAATVFVDVLPSIIGSDVRGGGDAWRAGDGVRRRQGKVAMVVTAAAAGVAATTAAALFLLQCGDSYFTAAYFHTPTETFAAAFLGLVMLQSVTMGAVTVPAARALGASAGDFVYGLTLRSAHGSKA